MSPVTTQDRPEFGDLLRDAHQAFADGDAEQLLPPLERLARSGAAAEVVRLELARMLDSPSYVPSGGDDALTLAEGDGSRLLLKVFPKGAEPEQGQLLGLAEHMLIANVGSGPLALRVYRESPVAHEDVFDATRALSGPSTQVLASGQAVCLLGGRDIVAPAGTTETTYAFVLTSPPVRRYQWIYSGETRQALRLVSADVTASRIEFAAQVLGELGAASSVPVLRGLSEHPAHFVRWSAIRSLMQLDFDQGLAAVRQAQHDPHPQVQNAAIRSLARMAADGVLPTEGA